MFFYPLFSECNLFVLLGDFCGSDFGIIFDVRRVLNAYLTYDGVFSSSFDIAQIVGS